ncbi:hypothetical protein M2459_002971 [Parabacteroides sp. PF5-5]|uniref:ComEA family DNA-binding protein n=1 Tax=unclassified Parabacteroides TaxID=2649774 RepID=UPI002476B0D2|nr:MULTISPECIES: helix-hairpin-helix domain-containing protein [unclassified Parabacteroides]MDH6305960.1 hypothetical protein [Parabacteroides sp. PH5-39]MDH6317216.1 hypothetical protein [Parabacteroides sp. PF5-13]MDH6320672.1 hypothetical protein [Parabacteroides sp. PH5-13]MDH6324407.1 hypothetical protein [Parabacteroides sp. PH5-8]MDH6328401.1 hypothetical protein [Parabacteroides sp. PH5-41]
MKKLFINLFILLLISCYQLKAQYVFSVDKWMEYVDELALEAENAEEIETLYNELSYLADHPLDLNLITAEQLRRLPFLSDLQIEQIINYRERYGKLVSIYELKNIEQLDFQTIDLLLSFTYIGELKVEKRPFTVHNLLKYGSNELQLRYDNCFQQKKGYRTQPDSLLEKYPNRQYLGEPFYHSLRYSYTFDDRLQAGFVAEKDAGEPFWNRHHKGYDYYSIHFLLKDLKWLKTLAIGDYKMSFGQGLVVSQEFTPGKGTFVTQAERRFNGFRRHFSTNENDFFRGAAATVSAGKKMDISFFYSYKKTDASIADSNIVTSIITNGLHRLPREREKRKILPLRTFGGNIRYATPNVCLGFTVLSYSFGNYTINPDPKPYNYFYFRGNKNVNASVDYLLKNRYLKFYGETAISQNKAISTLNALQLTPVSYISLLLLYRYYDPAYQAFYGNAFSQNTTPQNEQGLYIGLELSPFAHWKVSASADHFRFPWLKYGVDAPSSGSEYMLRLDYSEIEKVSFYIRYKYRQKEKNISVPDKNTVSVLPYNQHRLRMQVQSEVVAVYLKTSLEGVLYKEKERSGSKGIMLAQSLGWKPKTIPFQLDLHAAVFCTEDYASRLSSYEKNILYAFSMPSFYGSGYRLAATFRWNITNRLSLSAKVGHTCYSDREIIGSELEEIEGNKKTDMYTLLRWKF